MTEELHLRSATSAVQVLYARYREAILALGTDVTVCPTEERYVGFWVNEGRFIALGIRQKHFKLWFRIVPGTLLDPDNLTTRTAVGHTLQVRDGQHFMYIMGLIEQAYRRQR